MDNETLDRANMLRTIIAECEDNLKQLDKDPFFVNIDVRRCHYFQLHDIITNEEIEAAKDNLKELIRTRTTLRLEEAIKEFNNI